MTILETARLVIRQLEADDAAFVVEHLNEPAFLRYIGDKGVRTPDDAREYLRTGPLASYARNGFGLWLVASKETGEPVGTCGILKRDALEHPDLGYALLERHAGRGYAHEAASAVLEHARDVLQLRTLFAITAPENPSSIRLLGRLGFRFERMFVMPGNPGESRLFSIRLPAAGEPGSQVPEPNSFSS